MAQLNAENCIPTKKHRERTAHGDAFSALLLLVLRIFADDHDAAFSADDFAFIADRFYGRFHFHVLYLLSGRQTAAYARLFGSPCDPAT